MPGRGRKRARDSETDDGKAKRQKGGLHSKVIQNTLIYSAKN